jgi:hypothetical protein
VLNDGECLNDVVPAHELLFSNPNGLADKVIEAGSRLARALIEKTTLVGQIGEQDSQAAACVMKP